MDRIAVGYVARAHGVRGELRVNLHDTASTVLLSAERVWVGGAPREVRAARPTAGAVLLALAGVEDRDAAEALRGQSVEMAREEVPLEEGEFFLADLVGCDVVGEDGRALGRAVAVQPGPQDLLVIHEDRAGGGVEKLLPIVPELVVSVDLVARRVVVAPPEELPESPIAPPRPRRGGRPGRPGKEY